MFQNTHKLGFPAVPCKISSVAIKPSCEVQQLLVFRAQVLVTPFIGRIGGVWRLGIGRVGVRERRWRNAALERGWNRVVLVQQLLQRADVLHRRPERLHFAHLLIGRAVRDVLAQRLESHIDLFDAVPLAFVASRHRDRLLLRDGVSQPVERESPLAAQKLRWAGALSFQHLRLGRLRALLQDDGRVACTLRSIHVFWNNKQIHRHCQKTSDARLSCPSRGLSGVLWSESCCPAYLLQTLAALGFFNTRPTPHPLWRRTLLARDSALAGWRSASRARGSASSINNRTLSLRQHALCAHLHPNICSLKAHWWIRTRLHWMRDHKMCGIKGEWLYRCFWVQQWFFERVQFRFVLFCAAEIQLEIH